MVKMAFQFSVEETALHKWFKIIAYPFFFFLIIRALPHTKHKNKFWMYSGSVYKNQNYKITRSK